ncbi:MAG TPA: RHS repeat-associated core domain-containing protein [Candidatus Angelobacter sp.]
MSKDFFRFCTTYSGYSVVGTSNTGFFYNGGAITQELNGSTVTANIWNGGSSYFQRTDANGSVVPLVDGLGSVLALADANGNIVTQYTYDPFGGTTTSGTASANPNQYIGQENDLTGLYYFHARYYSPALHRFISEDPLGFGGGDVNLHAYGLNSPTNFRDPSGKSVPLACAIGGAGNTVLNWIADKLTGRKITLATSADYFVSGCKTGVIMEITGINWVIGKVFSGVANVATSAAGRLFTGEMIEAEIAAGTVKPVLLDTNAVIAFDKVVAQGLIAPGETPVISQTVLNELDSLMSSGEITMPIIVDSLPVIADSVDGTASTIGQIIRQLPGSNQGWAGDAIIGNTSASNAIPLITGDVKFAAAMVEAAFEDLVRLLKF